MSSVPGYPSTPAPSPETVPLETSSSMEPTPSAASTPAESTVVKTANIGKILSEGVMGTKDFQAQEKKTMKIIISPPTPRASPETIPSATPTVEPTTSATRPTVARTTDIGKILGDALRSGVMETPRFQAWAKEFMKKVNTPPTSPIPPIKK